MFLPSPLLTPSTKDDSRGRLLPPRLSSPPWGGGVLWTVRFEPSFDATPGAFDATPGGVAFPRHWGQFCGNSSLISPFPVCIQNGQLSASRILLCGHGQQLVWADQGANPPFLALCLLVSPGQVGRNWVQVIKCPYCTYVHRSKTWFRENLVGNELSWISTGTNIRSCFQFSQFFFPLGSSVCTASVLAKSGWRAQALSGLAVNVCSLS